MSDGTPLRIALAAGGTGGHMVPAHALDHELRRRGHETLLVTDPRGAALPGLFEDTEAHLLDSGRMTGNAMQKLGASVRILLNTRRARGVLRQAGPDALVGFGGYPSLAAGLAAASLGIPICLHEQNAVLGRTNRLLAHASRALALSFPETAQVPADMMRRAVVTGNPVRQEVAAIAEAPYPALDEEHAVRLLVVGGSLGARILADVVPDALALLPPALKSRLAVTQQCRGEDLDRVLARYRAADIDGELAPYFTDLPERLARSHLVIARAGASTIAELTAAGRPAILIPLAIATDDHQTANARTLADAGGAWVIAEADFTPRALAKRLHTLLLAPARLAEAAAAARRLGRPDAAAVLADLVEQVAGVRASAASHAAPEEPDARPSRRSSGPPQGERREVLQENPFVMSPSRNEREGFASPFDVAGRVPA